MTAIMLKDAPGGAQLIEALTAAAKGLSLTNANTAAVIGRKREIEVGVLGREKCA
jgi:hypothetical protein